ncbi:MmgE/PrpD family protein [Variovorax sp. SRS16]|uniref:MmgE/PrpD family protein n=1 Tax=Variovorax sp. SRS16 TaxID=282217 RepID=UPI001318B20D|nr:MmgE/PrpD family protein [Variovorax sp. SRS16]VTU13875.1 MmgE/PrpD family protein [Variovorax sp. SRS16]
MRAEADAPLADARRWDAHLATLHATVALHAGRAAEPAAAQQARRWLIDTLGCAIAGRHAAEVRRFEAAMAALEPSGAFRFPDGPAMGVLGAAQLIAMAATWDEACEGHALAHGRPGVPLIAALWPLALQRAATLAQFVDAFVLGYEVGARAGAWLRIRPGMHVDANWPALGVAAGVARLLGLDAAGIVQAIDIAACQLATSLYLPVASGRTARNTYLAHSALLGLQAAFASAAGIDAPADALAHYASAHAAASAQPLPGPEATLLLDAYLKPFAAVRHVHYGAVAAQRLRERLHADTSVIRAIELTIYEEATVYCGNRAPRTPIQAQFSLSFGLAAMLRFGVLDPSVYTPERFGDAELRRLEALVVLRIDPTLTARGERGATLALTLDGGHLGETVHTIAGDAGHPLDRAALVAKFTHYAARSVAADRAASFCDTVLDNAGTDLRLLWQQLAPAPLAIPSHTTSP